MYSIIEYVWMLDITLLLRRRRERATRQRFERAVTSRILFHGIP